MGLLPFTWAVEEEDRTRLERLMGTWWTPNGSASKDKHPIPESTPSSSRAASREASAGPRRSTRSKSQTTPILPAVVEAADSPPPPSRNQVKSTPRAKSPSKQTGARSSAASLNDDESSVGPYEFIGDAERQNPTPSSTRARPNSSSQAQRPPKPSAPSPSHHSDESDSPLIDDSERRRTFLARQRQHLSEYRTSSSTNVPPHLQTAYDDTEDMRHADSDSFVKSTSRGATSVRMPLKCKMAAMRNEYVDFSEVNGYDPTVATAHRFAHKEDGSITSEAIADKKEIPSLPIWLDIFEIYSEWVCRWYPDFKSDHDFYKNWMRTQYRHEPENFKAYLAFDAFVRTNIATDSYPYTLQEFTLQTTILFRFINKQNSSSSSDPSASSSSNRKRPLSFDDLSSQICHRFNDNNCPGGLSCGGRSHRCENCGGEHSGEDCTGNRSVTLERRIRRKAYESRLLANGGISGSSGNTGASGSGGRRGPAPA